MEQLSGYLGMCFIGFAIGGSIATKCERNNPIVKELKQPIHLMPELNIQVDKYGKSDTTYIYKF